MCPWQHRALGNTVSLATPCPWQHRAIGNTVPGATPCPWQHPARDNTVPVPVTPPCSCLWEHRARARCNTVLDSLAIPCLCPWQHCAHTLGNTVLVPLATPVRSYTVPVTTPYSCPWLHRARACATPYTAPVATPYPFPWHHQARARGNTMLLAVVTQCSWLWQHQQCNIKFANKIRAFTLAERNIVQVTPFPFWCQSHKSSPMTLETLNTCFLKTKQKGNVLVLREQKSKSNYLMDNYIPGPISAMLKLALHLLGGNWSSGARHHPFLTLFHATTPFNPIPRSQGQAWELRVRSSKKKYC